MMSLFLNKKVENSCIGTAKVNNIDVIYIGSEINFHFIRYLWNELCVLYIKYATSFINTVWNENLFQILFIPCLTHKNARKTQFYWVLLPILLRKTRQRRGVTYDVIDELRRLSLSKCFPPLCHKLIYHMILHLWSEISLFHKLIYDIAPGSILIGREVVVRLWRHW